MHAAHFGHQDRENDTPMTADTIFRIYSMTKPIVSTALMMLHEEGAFQLEHPVANFIPAFGAVKVMAPDGSLVDQTRPMTVRDLLMHTSGLTYDFLIDSPAAEMYRDARIMNDSRRSLADLVDALATLPLSFQPGERWHYSVGIDVAARLIEILSGQSIGAFLHARLFAPLGMNDTAFSVPSDKLDRVAAMYGLPDLIGQGYHAGNLVEAALSGFNERIDVGETHPTDATEDAGRGGVGLFSTADDYLLFAQMLVNNGELNGERILGRKTLELMHRNHLPPALIPIEIMGQPMSGLGFGLGSRVMVNVADSAGPGSDGEYGWAGAASTYYWVDPTEDLVGVFMTQYMTGVRTPARDFRSVTYQAIVD